MLRVETLPKGLRKGVIRMIVKDLMSSHIRTVLPDDPAELAAEICPDAVEPEPVQPS